MQKRNLLRIKRDCFWDENISNTEIDNILKRNDFRKKTFLLEKILLNSTRLFLDLDLFEKKDIEEFLKNYKIPQFNNDYLSRRKNLAEVYFLDKPLLIAELKWLK